MFKSTHDMLMRLQRMEYDKELTAAIQRAALYEKQVGDLGEEINKLLAISRAASRAIKILVDTNARMQRELEFKGSTKRVRLEQDTRESDPLMIPDIHITEEGLGGSLRQGDSEDLERLREELEVKLAALGGEIESNRHAQGVTDEALDEATVTSADQWRKQHRAPDTEDDIDLDESGR